MTEAVQRSLAQSRIEESLEISRTARDRFAERCFLLACKDALGDKTKVPQTPEEQELVADKLAYIRSHCGIFDYIPHKKQRWFHDAQCQVKDFQGSNQSGKTTASIVECINWMEGTRLHDGKPLIHPVTGIPVRPPIRAVYELDDFLNKGMEVLLPKLRELIPFDAMVVKSARIQGGAIHKFDWHNGSSLKLLSYEQMPKKHEGYTWDVVFFDEPPPRWAYIAARRGCMKTSAPLHFANTPLSEAWMQEEIIESPATIRVESEADFSRIKKNSNMLVIVSLPEITHLTPDQKAEFEGSLTEEEKAARIYGEALYLQGRVFKSYTDEQRVITEADLERIAGRTGEDWRSWPWGQVVDPHDRRPFAVAWWVMSPRNELIFVREWPEYAYYSVRNCEHSVDDYAEEFRQIEECFIRPPTWRLMDPRFGRTPKITSNSTLQEEFSERGFVYDCAFTDDQSIETGHMKVSKWLQENRLFMLDQCHNMDRAFKNYVREDWAREDGTRPAKEGRTGVKEKHKDFIDLVRYTIEADPGWIDQGHEPRRIAPVGGGLGARRI